MNKNWTLSGNARHQYDKAKPSIVVTTKLSTGMASTSSSDKQEMKDDIRAEREYQKLKAKTDSNVDSITKYLRNYYRLPGLCPYNNYTHCSFPRDEKGHGMWVTKYYPSIDKLCIDCIADEWPADRILAKKWALEQLGYKYTWVRASEVINDDKTFWARTEKLKTKPSYEIKPLQKWN